MQEKERKKEKQEQQLKTHRLFNISAACLIVLC